MYFGKPAPWYELCSGKCYHQPPHRLHTLWKLLGYISFCISFSGDLDFSLGPNNDLYILALVQMLTLKHSLAGFSGKHWNPCMLKQKWADSGKEIFSWPPAFMEQKPAETLNLPLLQILTQRLMSLLIAHDNIIFRCNGMISSTEPGAQWAPSVSQLVTLLDCPFGPKMLAHKSWPWKKLLCSWRFSFIKENIF